MFFTKRFLPVCIPLALLLAAPTWAHIKGEPSLHDTVAGIIQRLSSSHTFETLDLLTREQVESLLSDEEKEILATGRLSFAIDAAAVVSLMHDAALGDDPFWLAEKGFAKTDLKVVADETDFEVWEKTFEPGRVRLGIDTITGKGMGYFLALKAKEEGAALGITGIYPGLHNLGEFKEGEEIYYDIDYLLEEVPDELDGQILLRGSRDHRADGSLVGIYRTTDYPAGPDPEHVILTWSDDPKTTQTIQWRTSPATRNGKVSYLKKKDYNSFNRPAPTIVDATTERYSDPPLLNDPTNHRHTAVLRGLEPDTSYVYCVGDGSAEGWTELAEFATAPEEHRPFTFQYMGDAQNGLDRWGSLLATSYRKRPDAEFYVMAGDLINRGAQRDDWDSYFHNARGIFGTKQIVPCPGNHEYHGGTAQMYLDHFTLPTNGSTEIAPELSYSFEYGNALFVFLDSNVEPETQTEWLEETLANSKATWKFAVYHHPAYSSGARRDNPKIRKLWGDLFDKYHVDVALQGHDHAYLRTFPMKGGERVESPKEGTIYIVSVSGTKFYDQADRGYTEFGMTRVSTFQTLDIQIFGDRLVYRAYDLEENLRDEFVIEK